MYISKLFKTAAVAAVAGYFATAANAAVIYRENFSVAAASTGDRPLTDVGWNSYVGASAATTPTSSVGAATNAITKDTSAPGQADAAVNSNPLGTGVASRVFFFTAPSGTTTYLMNTSEYTIDRSVDAVTSFDWFSRDNTTNRTIRVAAQVGGNWYVTGASTAGSASSSSWEAQSIAFDAANWRSLNFVPGSALDTTISATPVALPSGNITAFGVWVQTPTASTTLRFDQFTINAEPVPEPTSLAAIGLVAGALLRRRRGA